MVTLYLFQNACKYVKLMLDIVQETGDRTIYQKLTGENDNLYCLNSLKGSFYSTINNLTLYQLII